MSDEKKYDRSLLWFSVVTVVVTSTRLEVE